MMLERSHFLPLLLASSRAVTTVVVDTAHYNHHDVHRYLRHSTELMVPPPPQRYHRLEIFGQIVEKNMKKYQRERTLVKNPAERRRRLGKSSKANPHKAKSSKPSQGNTSSDYEKNNSVSDISSLNDSNGGGTDADVSWGQGNIEKGEGESATALVQAEILIPTEDNDKEESSGNIIEDDNGDEEGEEEDSSSQEEEIETDGSNETQENVISSAANSEKEEEVSSQEDGIGGGVSTSTQGNATSSNANSIPQSQVTSNVVTNNATTDESKLQNTAPSHKQTQPTQITLRSLPQKRSIGAGVISIVVIGSFVFIALGLYENWKQQKKGTTMSNDNNVTTNNIVMDDDASIWSANEDDDLGVRTGQVSAIAAMAMASPFVVQVHLNVMNTDSPVSVLTYD